MSNPNLHAQDLSSHQWENRIILVLTEDPAQDNYKKQLEELKADKNGLQERKLLIYQLTSTQYKMGLEDTSDWQEGSQLYNKYKTGNASFEVILIGLDGGVKLSQEQVLSREKLFAVIDGMPMRKAEIRKNRN